ncbi:MAG: VOC family protein [Spirochaetaceae bacterium]|nr:VOC family protein [Spirochaetaceae bacterium]
MVPARVSLVTLGVSDIARSRAFYRALGWETGVDMDGFAVFRTGGSLLALYPIGELTQDLGDEATEDGVMAGLPRRTSLAINVGSPEEVDQAVVDALAAGAAMLAAPAAAPWGGYTAIFADPDGHAWEVAHNPGWPLGADGLPQLP